MRKYTIKLSFIRPIIGSSPANDSIRKTYIHAKMMSGRTGMSAEVAMNRVNREIENLKKDEDYQEKIEEMGDKALTVFYRDCEGKVSLAAVQIRGFIKDAFTFFAKTEKLFTKKNGDAYSQEAFYRDWIGDRIQIAEEYIPIGGEVTIFDRPIRCTTMQGERVSIASSECILKANPIEFNLITTDDVKPEYINAVFDRGLFRGIGQWANAQYGSFNYEVAAR